MRTVYLVRHGMVDFPGGKRRCIGRTDLPLNEVGRKQAEDLGEYFRTRPVEAVFCSPLARSVETAKILAGGRFPVLETEGLAELDMGEWENVPLCDLKKELESNLFWGRAGSTDLCGWTTPSSISFHIRRGMWWQWPMQGLTAVIWPGLRAIHLTPSRALTQPYGGSAGS